MFAVRFFWHKIAMHSGVYFYSKTEISYCEILPYCTLPVDFSRVNFRSAVGIELTTRFSLVMTSS